VADPASVARFVEKWAGAELSERAGTPAQVRLERK
jgi:hypothetical protein